MNAPHPRHRKSRVEPAIHFATRRTPIGHAPVCLDHLEPLTYCDVTQTYSATNVMGACPCVFERVVVNGIEARVRIGALP